MKTIIKHLIFVYIILILAKLILSLIIQMPNAFSDDYTYIQMAKNFFDQGVFQVNDQIMPFPPLYSLMISPLYILKNTELIYFFIKAINALLSSALIFPIYFLAKDFMEDKSALKLASLTGLIPSIFVFSFYVMSENLFFLSFTLSIYFLYKLITTQKNRYILLSGFIIGLSYLTRIIGVSLFGLELFFFIYFIIKKDHNNSKRIFFAGLITLLTITPLLIRNALNYGLTISGLLGKYTAVANQNNDYYLLLVWFLLHITYLFLATGIIFPISSILNLKLKNQNYKILFISLAVTSLLLLYMTATLTSGRINDARDPRPVGRYIDALIPLIILTGSIGLKNSSISNLTTKSRKIIGIILLLILIISIELFKQPLFPINNISLTYLGIYNYLAQILFNETVIPLLLLFILISIIIYNLMKLSSKRIHHLTAIFFILLILLNILVIRTNITKNWYNDDANQVGLWFNRNIQDYKETVLLDSDDVYNNPINLISGKPISDHDSLMIAGYWIRNKIVVDQIVKSKYYKYTITSKKLDLLLIKQIGNLKIYEK